jgi:hypothetical protein
MTYYPWTALDPHSAPTPQAVRQLRKEVYANAQAVDTSLGGGQFGHIGLFMPDDEYATVSPDAPYIKPAQPERPNYFGASVTDRLMLQDQYREELELYHDGKAAGESPQGPRPSFSRQFPMSSWRI